MSAAGYESASSALNRERSSRLCRSAKDASANPNTRGRCAIYNLYRKTL